MSASYRDKHVAVSEWRGSPRPALQGPWPKPPRKRHWRVVVWIVLGTLATAWLASWF